MTSASPFVLEADTNSWRQSEPLQLRGWLHKAAVTGAPVVLFPLKHLIPCAIQRGPDSLCSRLARVLFVARSVGMRDITFALVNTAIWLLPISLAFYIARWVRQIVRREAHVRSPGIESPPYPPVSSA